MTSCDLAIGHKGDPNTATASEDLLTNNMKRLSHAQYPD